MPAITLYPYQQQWIRTEARFKVGMFARQTGKTFTNTLELVDSCLGAATQGRRERWVILSRGERQAREAMEEGVKRHAQAYAAALKDLEYDLVGNEGTYKALEVELPGGSRITALPANPDTARGFSASVLLDEFAFHQDSRAIWRALFPVISAGHRLRVVSTPNGKGNKFYELMTGTDPAWYRQTVDIYRAVADGLPRNIDELRAGAGDPDLWAQEFELQWLDEASAWLPHELIARCIEPSAGDPAGYRGGPCYVGVDIALRRDLWVAVVLEDWGGRLWLRELCVLRRAPYAEQRVALDRLMRSYDVRRLCIDQTGMGEVPVQLAIADYGSVVEGVIFTSTAKLALATETKQAFESAGVAISGDADLAADLHKVQRIVSSTGAPRFVAERDGAGHADRFWALALAIHGATNPTAPIEYEVVPRSANDLDFGGWDEFVA